MRNLLILFAFMAFSPFVVQTQGQAQTYYNAPSSGGYGASSSGASGSYYNSPSAGYGSSAPLNIKGMLRGNSQRGDTSYYNNGSSYAGGASSYSLALSPQRAAENRAAYAKDLAERERKKEQARRNEIAGSYNNEAETQRYLSQFQDSSAVEKSRERRVLYNPNATPITNIPRRVFNSPY